MWATWLTFASPDWDCGASAHTQPVQLYEWGIVEPNLPPVATVMHGHQYMLTDTRLLSQWASLS